MTHSPLPRRTLTIATGFLLVTGVLAFSAAATPADGITVDFTADDMGFTVTSNKDISNVIVEFCTGIPHKDDGLSGLTFVHTETQLIVGVWVKSGSNGIDGDAPSGAGQRFDNAGVDCNPTPTPTPTPTPPATPTPPPTATPTPTPPVIPTPPQCPAGDARMTGYSYLIDGVPHADLTNNVDEGDHVQVDFVIAPGCEDIRLSLVSYKAPGPTFDVNTAHLQTVHGAETGSFDAGAHTMDVDIPSCNFQVDFVFGAVIQQLGPAGSNNFYGDQGRLIDADNGGDSTCAPPTPMPTPAETPTPTPPPTPSPVMHTICHATGSASNPFVVITISVEGVYNGHLGAGHQDGDDIIPPFTYDLVVYSQNWNAQGQATFANDCELVTPTPTPTPTETPTPTPADNSTPTVPPTPPSTNESTPTEIAPPSTAPAPPTTSIPVFPSGMSLILGVAGALGGAFLMFRRRL